MRLVLLHGWRQNKKVWSHVPSKLSDNVICLDLPGFGNEKLINKDWGVSEYANWVEKKINKYKEVILIGHSFGGRITAEIASKKPKWLKGIVLSGSPNIYRPNVTTRLKISLSKIIKPIVPNSIKRLLLPNELRKSIDIGLEEAFKKIVARDQTDDLKKISTPTLLIWGSNDTDVPLSVAKEINSLIKNSELKIIDNAGHNSFLQSPNLFSSYVKEFIKNIK